MRLYHYAIEPGDPDHLSGTYGIVEAEPDAIEAVVGDVESRHFGVLTVRPVEDAKRDFASFVGDLRLGLDLYHGEVVEEPLCPEDLAYPEADGYPHDGPDDDDSDGDLTANLTDDE